MVMERFVDELEGMLVGLDESEVHEASPLAHVGDVDSDRAAVVLSASGGSAYVNPVPSAYRHLW